MSFSEAQLNAFLGAYLWPLIRIGAMMMASPVFNSRQFPVRMRMGLALLITWVAMPSLPTDMPPMDVLSHDGFIILLQQIAIGVTMGFILQMVFGAVVFAGQAMAYSMGLGFASMVDPQNGVQVPVVAQFYLILTTLVFLLLNGHLILIELVVDSFQTIPVATSGLSSTGIHDIVAWASRMFAGGLMIALPMMGAMLMVNLGMGVVMRAAPQLNIFSIGFPITMLLGFLLISVTLPNVLELFTHLLNEGFQLMMQIFQITR
ncbi:flagellar biosynthetic protein FliR [endosymbiont of Lamellibrachia barhami]|uniref:flagellar biosynthetic protein FliR n=1 Tax=endosymbiont of Lamellibrachia barhami TaxID=205975 RepID=UPI0015B00396|nr:flagellar biosynthetic protein FliR [endosymbiont of Lamellibrachia barhami]